ncbi:ABC transporter substrate-binding protein [Paraburkholderia lycopersici]|uniref:ABC transporter substrate-binding protein n=1 Tax=Paraburkholderia lycopersici TaxID=416944 RepID=UPI0015A3F478|nr:ABC transporter substrate-binding protein [Paraburkholderia lycopersici]
MIASFDSGKPTFNGASEIVRREGWLESELKKRGVALEYVTVSSSAVATQVNEALANHGVDFAAYGDLPSIVVNAGGIKTRIIVPGGAGMNTYLIVPAGSGAKSIRDLVGKRVAINRGRPWEYQFRKLIDQNGLKFSDFRIINLNPQAGAAAIAAGKVDAEFTLSESFLLEDRKLAKIIWSSRNEPADWRMRAELWGTEDFVSRNPALTQVVATAFVKAQYWISQAANQDDFYKTAARAGTPESALRRQYGEDNVAWKDQWSPLFTPGLRQHYIAEADYAKQVGIISTPVDATRFFDSTYVDAALKELKLDGYWNAAPIVSAVSAK